jgi:hypothetical protein
VIAIADLAAADLDCSAAEAEVDAARAALGDSLRVEAKFALWRGTDHPAPGDSVTDGVKLSIRH